MLKIIGISFLVCLCFSLYAQDETPARIATALKEMGTPQVINYNAKRYHANPHNYAIAQDNNGIMYFGNLWGVLQFDGTNWSTIRLPNGVSCTSLAKDDTGTIYVGGRNELGYLSTDSLHTKYFVSLRNLVPAEARSFTEVWATVNTSDGILFVSREALMLKPKGKNEIRLLKKNISKAYYAGNQIFALKEGALSVFQNHGQGIHEDQQVPVTSTIHYIAAAGNKLLRVMDDGLYISNGENFVPWNVPVNRLFKSSGFTKIISAPSDRLVFITVNNGVVITDLQGNVLLHVNKGKGIPNNTISDAYLDKSGNLWLTSDSGISFVSISDGFSFLKDNAGITGTPYCSAIYKGSLYLGTSEGLFKKDFSDHNNTASLPFERVKGITDVVWSLSVFDHKLFCGQAAGAYVIDETGLSKIADMGTWLFHPVNDKLMLTGTYTGLGVITKTGDKWAYRNAVKGFSESSRYMIKDRYGDIWVSHGNKGVFQIRLDNDCKSAVRVKFFGRKNGLPADFDNAVYNINNEVLITGATGVFRYNLETEKITPFEPLTKILGPNVHIDKLVQAPGNLLWVVYNGGILAKVKIVNSGDYRLLRKTSKLKNDWIESFEHLNPITATSLIAGTQDGFALFREPGKADLQNFNCFISKFECTGEKPEVLWNGFSPGTISLKSPLAFAKNSLKITFTAPAYQDIENTQYRFYLQGFDSEGQWSAWSGNNVKEYTNLREGEYHFRVMAVNSDGTVSRENVLTFRITPPWYRTSLAYAFYVLVVVLAIISVFIWVKRKLENEKRKIEAEKHFKLMQQQLEWEEMNLNREKLLVQLNREKLEIEARNLHQEELLLEQNQAIERERHKMQEEQLQADLLAKNNELTSLTVNITQKSEVLLKIKNLLHKIKVEPEQKEISTNISEIESLVERNLNSTKEWERFREHFDVVHQGFLHKLQHHYPDLKASSLKLCAYLKMKLSSKQIATLMNTEAESVITARYRLRLKFKLPKETTLEEFLNTFE